LTIGAGVDDTILDVVMPEDWKLSRRVVYAVIGSTQGLQSQVVRLYYTELIIGAIGDLSHAIDALIGRISHEDGQKIILVDSALRL